MKIPNPNYGDNPKEPEHIKVTLADAVTDFFEARSAKVCEFEFSFAGDEAVINPTGLIMNYKGLEIYFEISGDAYRAELTKEQCDVLGIDPTEDYAVYWDENNTYPMDAVFQTEESFHDFG